MTDTNNELKDAIQAALSGSTYRDVPLGEAQITRHGQYVTDGGISTPPVIESHWVPADQVKALIDAWLDGTALPPVPGTAPPSDPPSDPPPPTSPPSPPPPPATGGTHTVKVTLTAPDGSNTWTHNAMVGEDWTVPAVMAELKDADGNVHPDGIACFTYSDGCDVGACFGDSKNSAGTLTIEYDGAAVFGPEAVQLPRGTLNKTVRYGPQAPWHEVDRSLFPNYEDPAPDQTLGLVDLSQYDFSYNGGGIHIYDNMATAGGRGTIAFAPWYAVPQIVQPSDAAADVVRKAADNSGCWNIYFVDRATGKPYDITQYPMTSFTNASGKPFDGNPLGMGNWSKSPFIWNSAHETGYNFVAAATFGTARDKFHASIWSNAMLVAANPNYRQQYGCWRGYPERASAWALRSLFLACYLSDMPDYFEARLQEQLDKAPTLHPLGFLATYTRTGSNGNYTGVAVWQENYVRTVLPVIAMKKPEWMPFAKALGANLAAMFGDARYPLWTLYVHTIFEAADSKPIQTMTGVLQATLRGPQGHGTQGGWSEEDIATATDPAVTPETLDALIRKYIPDYSNNQLGDFIQYASSPQGYPAWMRAACAGCVSIGVEGAGKAWAQCEAVPTKPGFIGNWKCNIVPRAA